MTDVWAVWITLFIGGRGAYGGREPRPALGASARLRELLGDQLDDPDARFELEIALR